MSTNPPPPMGDVHEDARACTRLVGRNPDGSERLCGKPPVFHVEWDDTGSGFICQEHIEDLKRWSIQAGHEVGSACGMPGALWFNAVWEGEPKSWCAYNGDGLPTVEPVRAVAQPVPALTGEQS